MRGPFNQLLTAAACFFAASTFAFGQNSYPAPAPSPQQQGTATTSGGWPRADASRNPYSNDNQQNSKYEVVGGQAPAADPDEPPPPPPDNPGPYANQNPYPNQPGPNRQPNYQIPPELTIPRGTYLTVRVNQMLSSDKNQPGDAFTGTLVQPVVVNGVVAAEPGETIGGRVAEAQKAGRIEGVARLGVQLTDLTLADGQKLNVQTQLISRSGPNTVGRDAGAIAGTTALGAAIGAAADWGRGAAIGAGAGAVAATIGVLVTRGHASAIYPEQVLTFRVETPVTFNTDRAPQAFHYVQPGDYDRQYASAGPGPGYQTAPPPPYYYPYPSYYGYPYPSPYYWGPSVGVFWGPSFYYGRGRGYYHRGWRR